MTTDIQLSKEEAAEFAEFLRTKVPAIDEKIAALVKEKESLLERISKLSGHYKHLTKTFTPVQEGVGMGLIDLMNTGAIPQTNIGKIKYILRLGNNKPMATRQILDKLFTLQPGLLLDKDKVSKNVSTVLSINQGTDKVFNRISDADGNYLFNINPEHMD